MAERLQAVEDAIATRDRNAARTAAATRAQERRAECDLERRRTDFLAKLIKSLADVEAERDQLIQEARRAYAGGDLETAVDKAEEAAAAARQAYGLACDLHSRTKDRQFVRQWGLLRAQLGLELAKEVPSLNRHPLQPLTRLRPAWWTAELNELIPARD